MPRRAHLLGKTTLVVNAQDIPFEVEQTLSRHSGEQSYAARQTRGNGRHNSNNYAPWSQNCEAGDSIATAAANASAYATPLIGCSPPMLRLFSFIERIAPTDCSALILGATGTGKELVARAIHDLSPRRYEPFVDINCSAIPDTLIEAELFGHQRGSFTGAHETRRGLFEEAGNGTLFLDEVDALNLSAQAKLLRVLQERNLRRVGGRENIPFNARVISATNSDLQRAVNEGTFRADLLFRLRVLPVQVPELRERGEEDMWLLIEHFLRRHAKRRGGHPRRFATDVAKVLLAYHWPGNVRELENAIEYALAVGDGEELGVHDLPPEVLKGAADSHSIFEESVTPRATLAEIERRYILFMLQACGGNQVKTAEALGINRRTLHRKLKEYSTVFH
ncbi:MAG: sigma-54 interaction domain-containing protein [Pyrinomonadaceae bacterium]